MILAGIAFTAMWLLAPMMGEQSVGSTAIDTSKPKADPNVEQSLAPADAGNGIDLSMDGTGHKRKEDTGLGSSMFFPSDDPAAAATAGSAALGSSTGGTSASVTGGTLAGALKKVGESGWGEKAHRGFDSPKLSGASLSGMGAAGGSKSAGSAGTSAFGSSNANVGFGSARGLSGDVKDQAAPGVKGVAALKATADQALAAARNSSNDGARNSLNQAFDGSKAGSKIGGNGVAMPGNYAALDTAPVNLKLSDPKLNEKKLAEPPSTDLGPSKSKNDDAEMAKQLAMTVVGGVLGGMIGGPVGGIVTNVLMQAVQRQEAQEQKVRDMEDKIQMDRAARRMGATPPSSSGGQ